MVATTASTKAKLMIFGGLFGSGRKMWCISGCLPYRSGVSAAGAALLGSGFTSMSKSLVDRPLAVPKEPMTMLAWSGFVDWRSCTGRFFWDCREPVS